MWPLAEVFDGKTHGQSSGNLLRAAIFHAVRDSLFSKSLTAVDLSASVVVSPFLYFSAGIFQVFARRSISSHSAEYKFPLRHPVAKSSATNSAKSRFFSASSASRKGLISYFSK